MPAADRTGQPMPDRIFKPSVRDEVADELDFHITMRARELVARGVAPDDARRMARERFDDLARVAAECHHLAEQREHAMKRTRYFTNLVQDVHFALRMLRRRPAFALLAIATTGLGIGTATAMYSVVDGVMLRPLPFADPGKVVAVWLTSTKWRLNPVLSHQWDRIPLGRSEYDVLRDHATRLRDVAMWRTSSALWMQANRAEPVSTARVTATMFPLLGIHPALGRAFLPGDDTFNGLRVALLSWDAWQTRFGGDPSVLGRGITLNEPRYLGDMRYTIVGVLPRGVKLDRTGAAPPIWLPAFQDSADLAGEHNRSYRALARLAPGATVGKAMDEASRLERAITVTGADEVGARVDRWQADQTRDVRASLLILLGAAGLLLVIASVNVATLMLGEATRRAPEIAARAALGAGPARLARQLLTESTSIAVLGAVLGSGIAWAGTKTLVALAPSRIPGLDDVRVDVRVLGFAVACAIITGIAFGLAPALVLLRRGAQNTVRVGTGQTARGATAWRQALIAAEIALSLILLVACSLLGRSLARLTAVDPGFRPDGLVAVQLGAQRGFWQDNERLRRYYASAVLEVGALPGVIAATGTTLEPFTGSSSSAGVKIEGRVYRPEDHGVNTVQQVVLPDYFHVLGIPVLAGRVFTDIDRDGHELAVVISEATARRDWPDRSPIGHKLYWQGFWWTIIGVVGDVKTASLSRDNEPTLYVPFDQHTDASVGLLVRTRGDVAGMAAAIRARLAPIDPLVSIRSIDPMPALITRSYAEERYRTLLSALFGALAAILAGVGIFGVISRTVARRMREAGIRVALGAPRAALTRLLMRETVIGAGIGLLLGLPCALLVARLLAPYLFGVTPLDPVAFGIALVLLVGTSLMATLPPARRAARVDPVTVLRTE